MNRNFNSLKGLFTLSVVAMLATSGCRENTLISSKVSPANDTAGVHADTLSCITHTYFDNDVLTSVNIGGLDINQAVGNVTDSFFGTMTGSTFFNIIPQSYINGIDTGMYVDSLFLTLPYSGFTYGDTTSTSLTQTYQVFYIGDTLGYNTFYYPFSDKPLEIPVSDPVTVNLSHLKDSVTVNGRNYHPGLHIKLSKSAILSKLSTALKNSFSATDKNGTFVSTFKGLCVRPADTRTFTKAMPYFRLNGTGAYTEAGIMMHYHNYAGVKDSFEFYHAQAACSHFNAVTKNYGRFPVANFFNSTQASDSLVALSNQPGASIDVKVYGVTTKIPKNVVINKATLQISLISYLNNSSFFVPDQVFPVGIGNGTYPVGIDAGKEYPVEDRLPLTSLSPYGVLDGKSHTITYGNTNITTYTIGLPREVIASIAAKNDTLHLHVHGTQIYYGAYRMIAAGGNYPDIRYKTKLIVVHSSLKN